MLLAFVMLSFVRFASNWNKEEALSTCMCVNRKRATSAHIPAIVVIACVDVKRASECFLGHFSDV